MEPNQKLILGAFSWRKQRPLCRQIRQASKNEAPGRASREIARKRARSLIFELECSALVLCRQGRKTRQCGRVAPLDALLALLPAARAPRRATKRAPKAHRPTRAWASWPSGQLRERPHGANTRAEQREASARHHCLGFFRVHPSPVPFSVSQRPVPRAGNTTKRSFSAHIQTCACENPHPAPTSWPAGLFFTVTLPYIPPPHRVSAVFDRKGRSKNTLCRPKRTLVSLLSVPCFWGPCIGCVGSHPVFL